MTEEILAGVMGKFGAVFQRGLNRLRKDSEHRLKLAESVCPGLKPALTLSNWRHD